MVILKLSRDNLNKLLFSFMLLVSFDVNAYNNEPQGFRGIKWGDTFDAHGVEMSLQESSDEELGVKYFNRKNDKLQIGEAKFDGIVYRYKNDKFTGVIGIVTQGSLNRINMKAALQTQFGAGFQPNKYINEYKWVGKTTYIQLLCDIRDICTFSMESMVAVDERFKERANKAKGAVQDF